jgi:hypothetical protein
VNSAGRKNKTPLKVITLFAHLQSKTAQKAAMMAMMDPSKIAIKAAAVAAKILIKMLLEMRKRPVVHWDPAIRTAHVLMWHRAPMNPAETQTGIMLRDMMDNGTWGWCMDVKRRPCDKEWVKVAVDKTEELKCDKLIGYGVAREADKAKDYTKNKVSLFLCTHFRSNWIE